MLALMFLIATVQGYLKLCSKQLKFSVTLYPPLPYIRNVFSVSGTLKYADSGTK